MRQVRICFLVAWDFGNYNAFVFRHGGTKMYTDIGISHRTDFIYSWEKKTTRSWSLFLSRGFENFHQGNLVHRKQTIEKHLSDARLVFQKAELKRFFFNCIFISFLAFNTWIVHCKDVRFPLLYKKKTLLINRFSFLYHLCGVQTLNTRSIYYTTCL